MRTAIPEMNELCSFFGLISHGMPVGKSALVRSDFGSKVLALARFSSWVDIQEDIARNLYKERVEG
ncbi:hypothetical protein DSO57_1020527 [Entomophthora muscae]|uniref:Uncharacterized protein n=1 Tax=Entomophthora muscae TaxID=34485 RepID=A0ACC2S5U0_9FUNG|nr:hypothetical protein DSO57_1020527 [Entomophthora muscae]